MKYIPLMCLLGATCIVLAGTHQYPTTLGRTHFIVGMTKEDYDRFKVPPTIGQSEYSSSSLHKVLFSPDDDIHAELLGMIERETQSIKMAMYLFTDKDIAKALRDAQLRGVCVECVTDASCISKGSNAMHDLLNHEIPVWVYRAANESRSLSNAMHHKFMIFGSSGKVVTGSLNITNAAQKNNQENIVVLSDDALKRKFDRQFGKLKTRCSRLMPQVDVGDIE
jgi:phosphatidylserine/phosphatidylglycerophosphate/cardiolipin synthase-like enzyme